MEESTKNVNASQESSNTTQSSSVNKKHGFFDFKKIKIRRIKRDKEEYGSELELIATDLIEETMGENGQLERAFERMVSERRKDSDKPLTEDDAKKIMIDLIGMAVAQRIKIISRIGDSVEYGDLFERYYGKLKVINKLRNNAEARRQKMERAKDEFDYLQKIYRKVNGRAYDKEFVPDDNMLE